MPDRPGARPVAGHDVGALLRTLPRAPGSGREGLMHAIAALHATHVDDGSRLDAPMPSIALDPTAAARHAAHTLDDHTIKLTEAVLREHEHAPRPVLLHVALHRLHPGPAAPS